MELDTQKPLESLVLILECSEQLDRALDCPRQQSVMAAFRAMSTVQKTRVVAMISNANAMHYRLMRMFMDDLLKSHTT